MIFSFVRSRFINFQLGLLVDNSTILLLGEDVCPGKHNLIFFLFSLIKVTLKYISEHTGAGTISTVFPSTLAWLHSCKLQQDFLLSSISSTIPASAPTRIRNIIGNKISESLVPKCRNLISWCIKLKWTNKILTWFYFFIMKMKTSLKVIHLMASDEIILYN